MNSNYLRIMLNVKESCTRFLLVDFQLCSDR